MFRKGTTRTDLHCWESCIQGRKIRSFRIRFNSFTRKDCELAWLRAIHDCCGSIKFQIMWGVKISLLMFSSLNQIMRGLIVFYSPNLIGIVRIGRFSNFCLQKWYASLDLKNVMNYTILEHFPDSFQKIIYSSGKWLFRHTLSSRTVCPHHVLLLSLPLKLCTIKRVAL